jgi:SAM-dependent methyltransferase
MNLIKRLKRYIAIHLPTHKSETERIISFWEKGGADWEYYQSAEDPKWLTVFWSPESVFYPLFQKLDLSSVLEIACGTGRHSAQVIENIKELYLLDSSAEALKLAAERFAPRRNIVYIHNKSGLGIPADIIKDNALTSVFSYDAMVHFEKESVRSYVLDSYRVLKAGGYALLHHSNYNKNQGGKFTDNPGWRNYMTQELFCSYAREAGFEVAHSQVFDFSTKDSDCITLLKKPF